jgi:hypothetical protein
VQLAVAGAAVAIAAGVFGVAFIIQDSGRVIALVIAAILLVLALALFSVAANRRPSPPNGTEAIGRDENSQDQGPGRVDDPKKSLSAELDAFQKPIQPPPERRS